MSVVCMPWHPPIDARDESEPIVAPGLVGPSSALQEIREKIELVASSDATVLVVGETGTGKEVVAREIHGLSRRRGRRMVTVNCAAVPRDLFESELFGHVRGSFTGAHRDRVGPFQLADGGTLFLDEVGEIPVDGQAKLLRVLQEGQFQRVGEECIRTADVRVVAATNRDLELEVREGRFRSDLFFRLNVFPIVVPPLRERPEDIEPLAAHLLELAARRHRCPTQSLDDEALRRLRTHHWPGNVRELGNVMERLVITARRGRLELDLPSSAATMCPEARCACGGAARSGTRVLTETEVRNFEHENLRAALRASGGRVYGPGGAAALLDIPPTTLVSRLQKLGLRSPSGRRRTPAPRGIEDS